VGISEAAPRLRDIGLELEFFASFNSYFGEFLHLMLLLSSLVFCLSFMKCLELCCRSVSITYGERSPPTFIWALICIIEHTQLILARRLLLLGSLKIWKQVDDIHKELIAIFFKLLELKHVRPSTIAAVCSTRRRVLLLARWIFNLAIIHERYVNASLLKGFFVFVINDLLFCVV